MSVEVHERVPAQREPLGADGSVDHVQSLVVILHHGHGQTSHLRHLLSCDVITPRGWG